MSRNRLYLGIVFLGLVVLAVFFFSGVWNAGKEPQRHSVSVIVNDSNNDRWIAMKEGLEQAAGDCGIDLNYVSTGQFSDVEEELAVIERELANNADGMLIQMVSSDEVYEKLEKILPKKAVMLLWTDISPEEYYASVTPDNTGIGKALAERIAEDFQGGLAGQRIGILSGNQEQLAMRQRLKGFMERMYGSGAVIMWTLDIEQRETLEEHEREQPVDILVSLENDETEYAADYLREGRSVPDECLLYGAGISEKAVYCLDRGLIRSLVVPNEFSMGYQSVRAIAMRLNYPASKEESSRVDYLVVDKENLYDVDNQKILFPIVQ